MNQFYFRFEDGQGVGNQLWCYLSLKSIFFKSENQLFFTGYENFKIKSLFPNYDFSKEFREENFDTFITITETIEYAYKNDFPIKEDILEKIHNLKNINNKIIELKGLFQKNCYLENIDILRNFLGIEKRKESISSTNECIIHIRGGDYLGISASLPPSYYRESIKVMKKDYGIEKFKIITNDFNYAKRILPNYDIIGSTNNDNSHEITNALHHIGGSIFEDFMILNNAQYIIMSNSTFAFWPVKLSFNNIKTIAPMYWFAYNVSNNWWSPEDSIEKNWIYIHHKKRFKNSGQELKNVELKSSNLVFQYWSYKARLKNKIYKLMKWTDLKGSSK